MADQSKDRSTFIGAKMRPTNALVKTLWFVVAKRLDGCVQGMLHPLRAIFFACRPIARLQCNSPAALCVRSRSQDPTKEQDTPCCRQLAHVSGFEMAATLRVCSSC